MLKVKKVETDQNETKILQQLSIVLTKVFLPKLSLYRISAEGLMDKTEHESLILKIKQFCGKKCYYDLLQKRTCTWKITLARCEF